MSLLPAWLNQVSASLKQYRVIAQAELDITLITDAVVGGWTDGWMDEWLEQREREDICEGGFPVQMNGNWERGSMLFS